jgi:hypothetical protein
MTLEEQARFKYTVYIDGNVGAGRLGALLGLAFVILMPPSKKPSTYLKNLMVEGDHYVPVREDLSDLREKLLWLRQNDGEASRISENCRKLWLKHCSATAMEQCMRQRVRSFPSPSEDVVGLLRHIWTRCRSAIYVLLDNLGRILVFAPFANENFKNDGWPFAGRQNLRKFAAKVKRITGEEIELPPESWWTNGSLVCKVMPEDIWGESFLPELRLLLQKSRSEF